MQRSATRKIITFGSVRRDFWTVMRQFAFQEITTLGGSRGRLM